MSSFSYNVNNYQIHELKSLYNEACASSGINLFASYDSNDILTCKHKLQDTLNRKTPKQTNEIKHFLDASSELLLKDMESKQASQLTSLYVRPVEQDTLNPNLKNVTRRIINIDSQYRENILPYSDSDTHINSSSTDFLANFSDPLTNVISLHLYSIQIPLTWYVIDESYGNNFFIFEDTSGLVSELIKIPSGTYTQTGIASAINTALSVAGNANVTFSWNSIDGKITIQNTSSYNTSFLFFDSSNTFFQKNDCNQDSPKIDYNLGWFLGFRNCQNNIMLYDINAGQSVTAEAVCDISGPKYFLLLVDDYNQNHLSKGLVNIDTNKPFIKAPEYYNPQGRVGTNDPNCTNPCPPLQSNNKTLTQSQAYTYNQISEYRSSFASNKNTRMNASTTTNIMAIIPLDIPGMSFGQIFTDNSSALEANIRSYFGPVNIEKMKIRLIDDRGKTVNLHGADWCFGLISEHLYKY